MTPSPLHLAEPGDEPRRLADWALEQVDTGGRLCAIGGPVGAGKSRVLANLREKAAVVVVEPPPLRDGDAVFHALAQIAAAAGVAAEAYEAHASVRERAASAAQRLSDKKILVLRLPSSWSRLDTASGRDQIIFRRRARELLQGLRDATSLRLVVLATKIDDSLNHLLGLHGRIKHLPAPAVRLEALRNEAAWGSYANHARRAAQLLAEAPRATPLAARVSVGCLALGAEPTRVAYELASPYPLRPLLQLLLQRLEQPEHRELAAGLAAVLAARTELPLEVAEHLAGLPDEHRSLLRDCVGYQPEAGTLRVTETVRLALGHASAEAHRRLSEHYRDLDGQRSLASLDPEHARAWLEKVHQLAHGGPETGPEWDKQTRDARELFWDRGRALSIDEQEYGLAAKVYEDCVARFPDDAYAWHYLGYNLDRAGLDPIRAEEALSKAATIDEENRWWHGRLITFLVVQARYDDALEATRTALDHLDPDGSRIKDDAQLSRDFHRHIVAAWLDAGEIVRARQTFDLLPPEVVARDKELEDLKWRLEDAEEAERLGDSVHPPGVPMERRWRRPASIADQGTDGARLVEVLPARVVEATEETVTLVVGVTTDGQHELVSTELTADEWQAADAGCPAAAARGYLYLAYYEGGTQRIFPLDEPRPPWEDNEPRPDPLRHLRTWASESHAAGE